MTTTALQSDKYGLALWIERSAAEMDTYQFARELVQNGGEAGATNIWIDAYTEPHTGRQLLRFTDDGCGMTEAQLVTHMKTLHFSGKKTGSNYGVGARLASLAANPSGVTFASRTADGSEALVQLHKDRGIYGLNNFEVVDDEGYTVKVEAVLPDHGELSKLRKKTSGTAVILHGDGRYDTWTPSVAYQLSRWLSDRYLKFPGDVTVRVQDSPTNSTPLIAFGGKLSQQITADGVVTFNVDGLAGTVTWFILDEDRTAKFAKAVIGGVGVFLEDELFKYSKTYSGDFGLTYRNIAAKVVLLVQIEGAQMNTARAGLTIPGHGDAVPWKKIGATFAEAMPAEIQALINDARPAATSITDAIAKSLDPDWWKKLKPVPVAVAAHDGDPMVGEEIGDAQPDSGEEPNPDNGTGGRNGSTTPTRTAAGPKPATKTSKRVTPKVEFLDPDEVDFDDYIRYIENANTVQVSRLFPPYHRDVARWAASTSYLPSIVADAVEAAYGVELAALIIDANGQAQYGLEPEFVAALKEPAALYAKCLSVQAIEKTIATNLAAIAAEA
ncbi:MAG TPA: ATP-binding protein [Acidimicrobiales bacterium]|nr:ATP-binding protein [Acidimicrobiales bacterium]